MAGNASFEAQTSLSSQPFGPPPKPDSPELKIHAKEAWEKKTLLSFGSRDCDKGET